ncbi:hypothetical protein BGP_0294 [Beggiatoa sp. PS]|nr:hypothetical protein BGP_0294 [Beggiatoa sp. PS]
MPFYSLETIHKIAKDENKIFLSRLAQRDASNLGYAKKDIAACLKALNHSNFLNTQKYNGIVMDAYRISCQVSSGNRDEIYIKLKLTSEYKIVISVGSFHLSR